MELTLYRASYKDESDTNDKWFADRFIDSYLYYLEDTTNKCIYKYTIELDDKYKGQYRTSDYEYSTLEWGSTMPDDKSTWYYVSSNCIGIGMHVLDKQMILDSMPKNKLMRMVYTNKLNKLIRKEN